MRILIIFIFFAHTLVAQIGTGQWRLHVPASKAVDVVAGNGLIYAAYENGLVEYDPEAKEQSLMTSVNSLSDINITCLYYLSSLKTVVVGYDNGNIDLLTDNRITNVPAIKLAQIPGSKRINKIVAKEEYTIFRGRKIYPKIIKEDRRNQKPISIEDYIVYPNFLENVIRKLESRIYEKAVIKSTTAIQNTGNNANRSTASNPVPMQAYS
jgi:hypothetical protein